MENIQAQLTSQTETKLMTLEGQKTAMSSEIEQLEEFQRKLNSQLFHEPKSKLIKKSTELVRQLQELNSRPANNYV